MDSVASLELPAQMKPYLAASVRYLCSLEDHFLDDVLDDVGSWFVGRDLEQMIGDTLVDQTEADAVRLVGQTTVDIGSEAATICDYVRHPAFPDLLAASDKALVTLERVGSEGLKTPDQRAQYLEALVWISSLRGTVLRNQLEALVSFTSQPWRVVVVRDEANSRKVTALSERLKRLLEKLPNEAEISDYLCDADWDAVVTAACEITRGRWPD